MVTYEYIIKRAELRVTQWACRDHFNTLLTCLSTHNRVSSDTTNASTIVSPRFCDMRRD
ncbi:hypothetical protein M378DRAFT_172810, partial [Amanita muscaria Koide BX008]